ncbi:peptidylprolyl isomerase [Hymenobacter sp. CRA2]|uniref:peptidylprolyl isomerase n=1 Tax=Hymenobacter sp. CRA2 TaxID=1955620 RepID=UPI00098FF188|nr:peptidylprolyl isomerase [Hymenobacter sp. CRA2]
MTPRSAFPLAALGLLLAACSTSRTPQAAAPLNQFAADTTLRRIATAQDQRQSQALRPFLHHPKARYRQAAAMAFASVQDRAVLPDLLSTLSDANVDVRVATAFALGQTADSLAAAPLASQIGTETDARARRYELEALGKCVAKGTLPLLLRVPSSATPTDTLLAVGQAWGLYRAGLRGLTSEAAVRRTVGLLSRTQPYGARLAAAQTLARTPRLDLTDYEAPVAAAATNDPSYAVRAAATAALGKVKAPTLAPTLAGILRRDPDYRVRVAALRAMNASMYLPVKEAAWAALEDPQGQVALTAAEFFLTHATGETGQLFLDKASRMTAWRPRAVVLAAALHHAAPTEKPAIREAIQRRYVAATDAYEKAFLLKALGEDPAAFAFVEQATFAPNQPPVVSTYGIEALVALRSRVDFPEAQQPLFVQTLEKAIGSNDVALIGTAAGALKEPKLQMRRDFRNLALLRSAQQRISLPRDVEAWIALQQALDYLENKTTPTPAPSAAAQHPIDWALVQTIPAGQRATVTTSKGVVELRLLVEEAPGSVASFVQLTKDGFYNGKNFHRVVPNFVAQGGCPRGDGWGGTDYTLRSEFFDRGYGEGAVGLASAGKDTESCQWFITHSPTPHLDGRYTIFAVVERGMDVVHRLDIGDRITSVALTPAGQSSH